MKNCPFCAEEIQDAAIVCKHCRRDLPGATAQPEALAAPSPKPQPPPKTTLTSMTASMLRLRLALSVIFVLLIGYFACSETPDPVREVDIAQTFFDAGMQHQHPLFGEDFTQAAESFRKAAEQGHAQAMSQLGYYYLDGRPGVLQDSVEAMKWFEKSAAHGDPGGCTSIGTMYAQGDGVPQDGVKAVAFYHKALEYGDRGALTFLTTLYKTGEAVPEDWVEAYKWTYLESQYGIDVDSAGEMWDGCFESLTLTPRQCETARGRARGWLREQGDSFPARSPVAKCGPSVEAVDDGIKAERVTESEPVELSLRDRITQAVERTPDLIARCRAMNPGVRLDTLEATQRGTDLVIHGAGRNVGDCALGGFKVRAVLNWQPVRSCHIAALRCVSST